jgi:hypothetical protein
MAADEITLSCKLIDDAPDKALIQTDVGEAWVYRSDFSIAKLGWADQRDQIRISQRLAVARGIFLAPRCLVTDPN